MVVFMIYFALKRACYLNRNRNFVIKYVFCAS